MNALQHSAGLHHLSGHTELAYRQSDGWTTLINTARRTNMRKVGGFALIGLAGMMGCAGGETAQDEVIQETPMEIVFGPADGYDLPGVDLERVQEGQTAPDFTLASLAGAPVTLSDFRGKKNVVLVFYRGHW